MARLLSDVRLNQQVPDICTFIRGLAPRPLIRGGGQRVACGERVSRSGRVVRLTEYCRTAEMRSKAAFLERTVANLSIDQYRRHARRPFVEAPLEELAETLPLLDPQPRPDEVFAARERLNTVRRVLGAVGIRTREVYLAHRAGYSHQELADEFGVSISTIEKDIARAVVALMDMKEPQ